MKRAVLPALVVVLLVAGCGDGGDGSSAKPANPGSIEAFDFGFKPAEATVEVGDTVTWTNTGEQIHNVKQLPGAPAKFFSEAIDVGESYEHRFTKPGNYPYLCTLHPDLMKGTLTVK